DEADDVVDLDARVGLVDRGDLDVDVGAKNLPRRGILREREDASERIGRNRRAQPLHHVAVVVVMRRLDKHQLKAPLATACGCQHWLQTPREKRPGGLYRTLCRAREGDGSAAIHTCGRGFPWNRPNRTRPATVTAGPSRPSQKSDAMPLTSQS